MVDTRELDLMVILGATIGALHRSGTTDQAIRETVEGALKVATATDALSKPDEAQ